MYKAITFLWISILISSCGQTEKETLAAFGVFCEMVANDAKPIALSHPLDSAELHAAWPAYEKIAGQWGVRLYREPAFPKNGLFPGTVKEGQHVIVIYRGNRLKQYLQWKSDQMGANPGDEGLKRALARRLGRLLGYGPEGINRLLSKHSGYRSLASFGVAKQVTHLYYGDPQAAIAFYEITLGLSKTGENRFRIGADAEIEIHPFDAAHPPGQPKSTAIALLTDQLPAWYAHVQAEGVTVKYPYKRREGGPHDGFVVTDPGGYLLEFEQFKQHPENERLMAVLAQAPAVKTRIGGLAFYGAITWTYHKDLLGVQQFYQEVLGFPLVADQGWTKIYQTSQTGFVGLVDERRGMQDYAQEKAVEVEWEVGDLQGLTTYAPNSTGHFDPAGQSLTGPEGYRYRFSGSTGQ